MTTPFVPQDSDARLRIREALDETLFVEAGAGTGKTTSLVDRVYALVSSGRTTLDMIAAITFTEAAAAELRDRIRERFERGAVDNSLNPQERQRAAMGLADLDQAWIQTLHSFSARLLQERPLEAGLPPSFEIMDQISSDLAFDEVWEEWWDTVLEDPELEKPLTLALSLGLGPDHLKSVARHFHANYDLLSHTDFQDTPPSSGSVMKSLSEYTEELHRLCIYSLLRDGDRLYDYVQGLFRPMEQISGSNFEDVFTCRLFNRLLPIKFSSGRQADWDVDPVTGQNACAAVKDLLKEFDALVTHELEQVRRSVLMPLLRSLCRTILNYAQDRKREGCAEFHDLLVWTRNLLRDNIEVRDHFRQQFSHLLIDEAQDTDPIQTEIAMFLAENNLGDDSANDRPIDWKNIVPQPGKLFIVGDPKQSIYRFRRADITQMMSLREHLGNEPVRLQQNFRSHKVVLKWVNEVFARWMKGGPSQAEYTPVSHRWELEIEHSVGPGVWYLEGEQDEKLIDSVRRKEAQAIATMLKDVVMDEWQVLDAVKTEATGEEQYRPARFSDICILMPTRTSLPILELAMDNAEIPYRLEGASLVFGTQEIRDLINCLMAIDDPSDRVAIVAALRSPAFGCSDVELLVFAESGGQFDYLAENSVVTGPVMDALDILGTFHRERLWTSITLLVDRFVRDRMLMESALSDNRTRQQWRRYRFLIDQARAFMEAGGNSLREFLNWINRQATEGARVTEVPVQESDEDAVRVMTIHGAKGLEFPVVVLTGLNASPSNRAEEVIFVRDTGKVEVRLGPSSGRFMTNGHESAAAHEASMAEDERVRLLYVAATRARDHLVLSMYKTTGDSKSLAAVITQLLNGRNDVWTKALPNASSHKTGSSGTSETHQLKGHSLDDQDNWVARRNELLKNRGRPLSVAATTIAQVDKGESLAEEPWKRGRGGTSIGRAVHAVLQTIDLKTGAQIEEVSQAQAAAEGISHRHAEIVGLVSSAIATDVVKRAMASGKLWREVPVGIPIADGVLDGFIDLLFEEKDGLVVVDYKTDDLDARDTEDVAQKYRLQGGAYALALQRATGKTVKEVVFLFLRPKREETLRDIPALIEDAEIAALVHLRGDNS
jgi:ATP-dependent exoDNAse (exonuclease V) beta subunit